MPSSGDSRDIYDLVPDMRGKVLQLLTNCMAQGVEMRLSMTLRRPEQQARLWRQSRTSEEIAAEIGRLKDAGATYLAGVLDGVGPQFAKGWSTDAVPGLSWHQWGEAVDCFWVVDQKAEWSTTRKVDGKNGYQVYTEEAGKLDLTAGGTWKSKDWVHAQLRPASSPLKSMSLKDIDQVMADRFGGQSRIG